MSKHYHHVFLTGLPQAGKTTLIKKILDKLKVSGVAMQGFYTEELCDHGSRIGFDVVALNGARAPLARIESQSDVSYAHKKSFKVGRYSVKLNEFEKSIIPELGEATGIVVIDEVGKMELFSSIFKQQVQKLLNCDKVTILGTIPCKKGNGISFVENIRNRTDVKVFEVSVQNRDNLLDNVLDAINNCNAMICHNITQS